MGLVDVPKFAIKNNQIVGTYTIYHTWMLWERFSVVYLITNLRNKNQPFPVGI